MPNAARANDDSPHTRASRRPIDRAMAMPT